MYLIQHIICYFIYKCHQIKVGYMSHVFALSISKGWMHLLILQRKTCWTTLEGIFVVLAKIARTRRNIMQMMC
jgi:hypothetical protein